MEEQLPHKLQLDGRRHLTMTGVTEVVSFDDTAVVLQTVLGTLVVQGQELQLKKPVHRRRADRGHWQRQRPDL